jgi:GH15 family glucan-1,4-alpha-glucosidase
MHISKEKPVVKQTESNGYAPIENYGVIGDMNTVALVGLDGSVDFMCFPDFDSPSLFARLLDRDKGGYYCIRPASGNFHGKQLYLPDTNILLTRFLSAEGIGELTDFMPVQELGRGNELIRRVRTVKGEITYQLACAPRFDYGRAVHKVQRVNNHELLFSEEKSALRIRLKANVPLKVSHGDGIAIFSLKAGECADFIFAHEDKPVPGLDDLEEHVNQTLADTNNYWKDWSAQSGYQGRWQEIVRRSALLLKLLTSYRYGSLVAAPTFGLPEQIGGERNWDYRYTWIRDASFTVYCLLGLNYVKEAGNFIDWVAHKCFDLQHSKHMQIMYKLDGSKRITEKQLKNLEGYKQSSPVRIGNAAYRQVQLDIYGELLDAVYLYDKHAESISYEFWTNLAAQIDWLAENWQQKDDGIWEVRGGKKHFLYSRLMSWVAFDRAAKIATSHSYPFPEKWEQQRDAIFRSIHKDFWNKELQAFVQYEHADVMDAATLMMPIIGFIGPRDPKWLSTLRKIEERLVDDFLIYRYHERNGEDGLKGDEGTFSMCTFWYIECLSMAGELEKAQLYFEKMLGYANHLGLYAEQLGFSGEQLGNFPQAFTHLGLISAALSLDKQLNDRRNTEK